MLLLLEKTNFITMLLLLLETKIFRSEENILKIIKNVSNALWMIDGNHEKFNTAFTQVI